MLTQHTDSVAAVQLAEEKGIYAFGYNTDMSKFGATAHLTSAINKWGKQTLTTSEGVIRFRKVEYTLAKWVENFEAYLRSAMSYSDAVTLQEFIGQAKVVRITNNSYNRFNK